MSTIVTRAGKGSPLTNTEVDNNFTNLNTDKVEKSGSTMTGDLAFGDNVKAKFGASNDLQIYHNGTHSYVQDVGTGHLLLLGNDLRLANSDWSENYLRAVNGGEVGIYYDNAKKLATTSSGVDVTGTVVADGIDLAAGSNISSLGGLTLTLDSDNSSSNTYFEINADGTNKSIARFREDGDIYFYEDTGTTAKLTWDASAEELQFKDSVKAEFGDGGDLQIYANSGFSYIDETGAGNLNLRTNGANIGIYDTANSQYMARFTTGGDAELYYNGSEKLATTSTGIDVTGTVTADKFEATSTSFLESTNLQLSAGFPRLILLENDTTNLNSRISHQNGALRIETLNDAGTTGTKRLDIDHSTGDISFYNDAGTSQDLYWDASASRLGLGTTTPAVTLDVDGGIRSSASVSLFNNTSTGNLLYFLDQVWQGGIYHDSGDMYIRSGGTSSSQNRFRVRGNGDISFYDSSVTSEDFYWDASTSRLGIGTTSPIGNLTINSDTGGDARGLYLTQTSSDRASLTYTNTSGELKLNNTTAGFTSFYNNGSEAMRIDSSGRVGIGTTSPSGTLSIDSTGSAQSVITTSTDGSSYVSLDIGGYVGTPSIPREVAFFTNSFGAARTERMRIDSSGNVGIGTTSPQAKLHLGYGSNVGTGSGEVATRMTVNATYVSARNEIRSGVTSGTDPYMSFAVREATSPYATVERMRITQNGNIGIGTTSPDDALQVVGGNIIIGEPDENVNRTLTIHGSNTSNKTATLSLQDYIFRIDGGNPNQALELGNSSGSVYGSQTYTINSNFNPSFFKWVVDSTEVMRVTEDGNIGINTTSPSALLDIYNTNASSPAARFYGNFQTIQNLRGLQIYNNQSNGQVDTTLVYGNTANSYLAFGHHDGTSYAERMRIDSQGRLGIGTTSPSFKLDVQGTDDFGARFYSSDATSYVSFQDNSTTDSTSVFCGAAGNHFLVNGKTATRFLINASEAARIDSSGDLLIGTTNSTPAGDNTKGIAAKENGTLQVSRDGAPCLQLNRRTSDGNLVELRKDGTTVGSISVTSSATTYNTTSDARLKTSIEPIANATDRLMQMNPISHKWIDSPEADSVVGFIAQEMQGIVPEAVSGTADGEEMMAMDYGRITPVLVAALQEALTRIESLENQIFNLTGGS